MQTSLTQPTILSGSVKCEAAIVKVKAWNISKASHVLNSISRRACANRYEAEVANRSHEAMKPRVVRSCASAAQATRDHLTAASVNPAVFCSGHPATC